MCARLSPGKISWWAKKSTALRGAAASFDGREEEKEGEEDDKDAGEEQEAVDGVLDCGGDGTLSMPRSWRASWGVCVREARAIGMEAVRAACRIEGTSG